MAKAVDINELLEENTICGESTKTIEQLGRFHTEVKYLAVLGGHKQVAISTVESSDYLRVHSDAVDKLSSVLGSPVKDFKVYDSDPINGRLGNARVEVIAGDKIYRLSMRQNGLSWIFYKRDTIGDYGTIKTDLNTCGASTLTKAAYAKLNQIVTWSQRDHFRNLARNDEEYRQGLFSCPSSKNNPRFFLGKDLSDLNRAYAPFGLNIASARRSLNLNGYEYSFTWTNHKVPRIAAVHITKTGRWSQETVRSELLTYDHEAAVLKDQTQILGRTGNDRNVISGHLEKISESCLIGVGFSQNSQTLVIWSDYLVSSYGVNFDKSRVKYEFMDGSHTQFMVLGTRIVGKKDFDEALEPRKK
ncbi:MAG: hypothetical protein R3A80_01065 [Bdellovibrionota bacterium]